MAKIALLGTGIMGTGMAHSLLREGHEVTVWNRSADKAAAVGEGSTVASSPAEAVQDAEFVITMFSDGPTTEFVADQFLPAMNSDQVWIQMGTIGTEAAHDLAHRADEQSVPYVEAPVMGTKQPAETGNLRVLAAGPFALKERLAPVFDAIGAGTTWISEDVTKASAMKLVANGYVLSMIAGLAETISFAENVGVDPQMFLDAIKGAPMDSVYTQARGKSMIDKSYEASFPLNMALKDARLIGAEFDGELVLNTAVQEVYNKAAEMGHGHEDMAAVIEAVRSSSD